MTSAEENDGPMLASPYKDVPVNFTAKNLCEFLFPCAQENMKKARCNWLTNTVTGETLTFGDIDPMSRKVASAMVRLGMEKGDVAVYMTLDVTRAYAVMLGIWRIGGILHSSYPEETYVSASLQEVKCATKVVSWPVEIILFGHEDGVTAVDEIFQDDGEACPVEPVGDLDDPALILCTSGTTGRSKGAIYTNRCIMEFCTYTDAIPFNPAPALYVMRCTHVLGALVPLRGITNGTWGVMMNPLTKKNLFHAVHKYKPFLAFGFPTYLAQLVNDPEAKKYDFSSLEFIITGGIVLTPQYYSLMMTLPSMKAVINGFGMTECVVITTTLDLLTSISHTSTLPPFEYPALN